MPNSDVLVTQERLKLMKLMDEGEYKIPNRRIDENLLIATRNIQQFNNRKTDRALQYISDICERFDILALQELKTDLKGLSRLQKMLPGDYRVLVTDPTGNYERLVFLYDKRTVIPTGLIYEIGFPVTAAEHVGYQLHRMPYCASFRASRLDFIVVSVHIYYGQTAAQKEERRKWIQRLVEFIRKRVSTDKSKVFDKDFIVVGDFNIEEFGDEFFNALTTDGLEIPEQLKTLTSNFRRTKTFDKIAYAKRDSFKFDKECNVVPIYKVLYQDKNPKGGKKEISDHLPL